MSKHESRSAPGQIPLTPRDTGEPMTVKQAALLRYLCEKHGEEFKTALTRRQAQRRIDTLRRAEGRDRSGSV